MNILEHLIFVKIAFEGCETALICFILFVFAESKLYE